MFNKPGFISGGGFLRDMATQTTNIPTHMTTTVAQTGTIMLRSNHSGTPGKPAFDMESEPPAPLPNGGAIVPKKLSKIRGKVSYL